MSPAWKVSLMPARPLAGGRRRNVDTPIGLGRVDHVHNAVRAGGDCDFFRSRILVIDQTRPGVRVHHNLHGHVGNDLSIERAVSRCTQEGIVSVEVDRTVGNEIDDRLKSRRNRNQRLVTGQRDRDGSELPVLEVDKPAGDAGERGIQINRKLPGICGRVRCRSNRSRIDARNIARGDGQRDTQMSCRIVVARPLVILQAPVRIQSPECPRGCRLSLRRKLRDV